MHALCCWKLKGAVHVEPNEAARTGVSLTIDYDTPQVMEITGLSMAAHASLVVDRVEAEKALRLSPDGKGP
jgi:hypothetical protein